MLSIPGFLSRKNLSDIKTNIVDGNTTWSQQDAYGKLMIAGSLNQSRRIFELFEKVLQGEAPEILVEKAHDSTKTLL